MSESKTALLFIHALTGLHPGSGTALGTVDLPVQRERHTNWPVIPGSALKGILRDACRKKARANYGGNRSRANEEDPKLTAVFGPDKIEDPDTAHAGALSLTDARILAFPVRSLCGVFAWVTCPAVLERLNRDLKLLNETAKGVPIPKIDQKIDRNKAACSANSPLLIDGDRLVLEEFEFVRTDDSANGVAEWIAAQAVSDETTQERIKTHLAVLYDDDFTHFVRYATEVVARIGLDYERKTVKSGALFYEEFLPPETLFYALAIAAASRSKEHAITSGQVIKYVQQALPPVLQIGGDETIGKGLCAVRLVDGGEEVGG